MDVRWRESWRCEMCIQYLNRFHTTIGNLGNEFESVLKFNEHVLCYVIWHSYIEFCFKLQRDYILLRKLVYFIRDIISAAHFSHYSHKIQSSNKYIHNREAKCLSLQLLNFVIEYLATLSKALCVLFNTRKTIHY